MRAGKLLLIVLAILSLPLMAGSAIAQTITLTQIDHTINDGGNGIQEGDTINFTFTVEGSEFDDYEDVTIDTPGKTMSFSGPTTIFEGTPPNTIDIVGVYTITSGDITAQSVSLTGVTASGDPCGECSYDYSDPVDYAVGLELPSTIGLYLYYNDQNTLPLDITYSCTNATPSSGSRVLPPRVETSFELTRASSDNTCTVTVLSPPSGYNTSSDCTNMPTPGGDRSTCSFAYYHDQVTANIQQVSDAMEPGQNGAFEVTLSGPPPYGGITIDYEVTGTATADEDYTQLTPASVRFPTGSTSQQIPVAVIDDQVFEPAETVIVSLQEPFCGGNTGANGKAEDGGTGGGSVWECYDVGNNSEATVEIEDDDGNSTFIVRPRFDDDNPVTVTIDLTCTDATPSSDSQSASNSSSASFELTDVGANNTCSAVQSSGPNGYDTFYSNCSSVSLPPGETETCYVYNEFQAVTAQVEMLSDAAEPDQNGAFTISLSSSPPYGGMDIYYSTDGSATSGQDYESIDEIFVPYGTTSLEIPVTVIDDEEAEDTETVEFSLSPPPPGQCGAPSEGSGAGEGSGGPCETYEVGQSSDASVDIIDDDGEATFIVDTYFDDGNPVTVSIQMTCSDASPSSDSGSASHSNNAEFSLMNVGLNNTCSAVQSGGPAGYNVNYDNCTNVSVPPGETTYCYVVNLFEAVTANLENAGTAAEPNQDGAFRIVLSGSPPYGGMEVQYQVGGTATQGEDYEYLDDLFIPFGTTSLEVPIEVLDDDETEPVETVEIDLLAPFGAGGGGGEQGCGGTPGRDATSASSGSGGGSSCETYEVGEIGTVTVDIEDDDDSATFTVVKWFEDENPATIQVTLSCTDASPSSSTKSATHSTPAVFNLSAVGSGNSCTATESGSPAGYDTSYYNCSSIPVAAGSSDVCYIDNYFIPVTAQIQQQSDAAEPSQDGGFQITLSGSPPWGGMDVNYTVGGTATAGADYEALGDSVFVAYGSTTLALPVAIIDDNILEEMETVVVTLAPADGAGECDIPSTQANRSSGGKPGTEDVCEGYEIGSGSQATVEISDDDKPLVAIEAVEDASEPSADGSFRVFLAVPAPQGGTTVRLVPDGSATAGVDYDSPPGELVFAEGDTSITVIISPIDDEDIEGTEQVKLFIGPEDHYSIVRGSSPAQIDLNDDDVEVGELALSVAATTSTAEPSGTGVLTVSLSEISQSDTSISFTLGGTATAGVDFVEPASPVVIPAGTLSATIDVVVIDDDLVEETESVSVTISPDEEFTIIGDPTASIDIEDDDVAELSLSLAATSSTAEPSGTGVFTVSLSEMSESDTSVSFSLGGTATPGLDFMEPTSPVVIPAGALSTTIDIVVIDDDAVEETETVSVTVSSDGGIPIVGDTSASINIEDDDEDVSDPPGIEVDPTSGLMTTEAGGTAQFGVVLKTQPSASVMVALASSDTTEGTISPESLEFNASNWNTTRTVTVTGVDDTEIDGDVAYSIVLSAAVSGDPGYSGLDPADVAVTNKDDDVEPTGGAEFSTMLYSVREVDGSASIGIMRTGSTSGALTVTFSTDDEAAANTAVAGEDYTSTTSEVSWADGESDEKFVSVQVFENTDKDDSATESLSLTLTGNTIETQAATLEIISEPSGPPISPEDLPPNQQQVVKVINESCPQFNNEPDFQALCTAMVATDSPLGESLRETTADDAAVVRSSGMQTANIQVTAVDGRIGTLRGGGGAGFTASGFSVGLGEMSLNGGLVRSFISAFDQNSPQFMQANANGTDDDNFIDEFGRWGAWISGRVIMGEKDQTTNQLDYDFDTAGVTFGMDYRFSDTLVAGVAVGYANTDADLGSDDGKVDTTGYSVSLYGTWFPTDNFYMGASLGYGGNEYDHTRNVRYTIARPAPGNPILDALPDWAFDVDQSFAASYDGRQYSGAISGGWDFNKNGWTFGPTFRLDWTSVKVDGYDENLTSSNTGNVAQFGWAVHIDDQKYTSLQPAIGFEFTKAISASWGIFIPQGYLDVVSELNDDGILVTGRYLGDVNRVPFALETDDFTETFVRAGLGFGLVLKNNKSAFFMVDGDLGRDLLKTYYINAGFRWQF